MSEPQKYEGHFVRQRTTRMEIERVRPPTPDELKRFDDALHKQLTSMKKAAISISTIAAVVLIGLFSLSIMIPNTLLQFIAYSLFPRTLPLLFILPLLSAGLSKLFENHDFNERFIRKAWHLNQSLRKTFDKNPATKIDIEWETTEEVTRCEVWIAPRADGSEELRWTVHHDRAQVLHRIAHTEPPSTPVDNPPLERLDAALPMTDGGFAMALIRTPHTGSSIEFGLEIRSLTSTQTRLTLPIALPDGIDPEQLPTIDAAIFDMDLRQAKPLTDALLERACALQLHLSPSLERLITKTVAVGVQVK